MTPTDAQIMRTALVYKESGAIKRALFGGLVAILERNGSTWRLSVERDAKPPTKDEIADIAKAFGLPGDIVWSRTMREQVRVVGGSAKTYKTRVFVAETMWVEK